MWSSNVLNKTMSVCFVGLSQVPLCFIVTEEQGAQMLRSFGNSLQTHTRPEVRSKGQPISGKRGDCFYNLLSFGFVLGFGGVNSCI